jgi:predicted Zn-dependent protease
VVLKNGTRVQCSAPYLVVNGVYKFRDTDGKDQSVPAEAVDAAKTAAANAAIETAGSQKGPNTAAGTSRVKASSQKDFRPNPRAALYLLPLGSEAEEDTIGLASYLHDALGLMAEALPAVDLDRRHWNEAPLQWNAEGLVRQVQANQARIGGRPNAVVVGVTKSDMYPPDTDWRFVFAWRSPGIGLFGVISTARLSLPTEAQPIPTEEVRLSRLRKILLRQVGILYYRLPLGNDPRSVLLKDVLGVGELDTMELRY